MRRPIQARSLQLEHEQGHNEPKCELAGELAEWRRVLFGEDGAGGIWAADVKPALETVHGFGHRLEKLCKWFGGKWPWLVLIAYLVLDRTVDAAPGEVPKLLESLGSLVSAFT